MQAGCYFIGSLRTMILMIFCACRTVQHPNILCILGSVMKENKIAIISNLVRGSNLEELIFKSSTKVAIIIIIVHTTCQTESLTIASMNFLKSSADELHVYGQLYYM